jgi:hypothetical protein
VVIVAPGGHALTVAGRLDVDNRHIRTALACAPPLLTSMWTGATSGGSE